MEDRASVRLGGLVLQNILYEQEETVEASEAHSALSDIQTGKYM